jgi:NADH-quinone oxidoreductase subunit K
LAVTVSNPSTLALLLIGAVLFGLGLIGFVSRTRAVFAVLCWGAMILGAVVTMHAGTGVRAVQDRTIFALAAIVIAMVEGGLLIAIAGRSTPAENPDRHSAPDEAAHE